MTNQPMSVSREEVLRFLEGAARNWSLVPRLSEDDIGDLASELLRFVISKVDAKMSATLLADAVKIKPLEWENPNDGDAIAESIVGTYFADTNGNWSRLDESPLKAGDTLEAAKFAANSDYEQRVRSALLIVLADPT